MRKKIVQSIPLALALAGVGFSYFSLWCTSAGHLCYRTWLDGIFSSVINPLYFFSLYFLFAAAILLFVSRPIFNSWLKFAAWMVPIAFIIIANQPVNWTGIGINPLFVSRDDMARGTAEILTAVSLVVIVFAYIRRFLLTSGARNVSQVALIMQESGALFSTGVGSVFAMLLLVTPNGWSTLGAQINYFIGMSVFGLFGLGYTIFLSFKKKISKQQIGWRLWISFAGSAAITILILVSYLTTGTSS